MIKRRKMTRQFTSAVVLIGMLTFIGFDVWANPPNPYQAPPIIALGSGLQAAGGFCGSLPN